MWNLPLKNKHAPGVNSSWHNLTVHNLNKGIYYHSIQDAIDNASDGDTIFVYNGIYHERISISKSINLIGKDEYETVIDGDRADDPIIDICTNWVNISNFTVRNSNNSLGAILMYPGGSHNTISYCYVTKNSDGMAIRYSNNVVSNCTITNNTRYGIYLYGDAHRIISHTKIEHNTWGIGGDFGDTSILYCNISHNTNGINWQGNCNNNTIWRCCFYNNDNGIYVYDRDNDNNEIIENSSHWFGKPEGFGVICAKGWSLITL